MVSSQCDAPGLARAQLIHECAVLRWLVRCEPKDHGDHRCEVVDEHFEEEKGTEFFKNMED